MDWIATLVGGTRARILRLLRRSAAPIAELAESVGITGNAVRGHVSALQKDGLVQTAGTAASTGGKPAQLYDLTAEGEEAFPKAYAFVLGELIRALRERDGQESTIGLLRAVGKRAAELADQGLTDPQSRVEKAADLLRTIGGDVTVIPTEEGWEIRGFGCPLSAVVLSEPDTCTLAQGLISDVTKAEVIECCDRNGGRARCNFRVLPTEKGPPVSDS